MFFQLIIMCRCFYLHKFSLKLRLLQIICIWSILFIFISHHMMFIDGKNYRMLKNIAADKQIVTLAEDQATTGKHLLYTRFFIFSCILYFSCPAFLDISGPPNPSYQKEQESHEIGPQMSRIGTRKVKETQKQHSSLDFWKYGRKIF